MRKKIVERAVRINGWVSWLAVWVGWCDGVVNGDSDGLVRGGLLYCLL